MCITAHKVGGRKMAQGVNYNLISPFGSFGGSAGNPAQPVGPGTGWFYDSANNLGAAVGGSEVAYFNANSQLVLPQAITASFSTVSGISFGTPGYAGTPILFRNGSGYLQVGVGDFSSNGGIGAKLFNAVNVVGYGSQFCFNGATTSGLNINATTVNMVYANVPVLSISTIGLSYYTQVQAYNTVTFTPGTLTSGGLVIAAQGGATTINVQLPTTVAGLTFTIGNFVSGATVIISPQAAADILIFNSAQTAKAAGASTVSGLKYSSITFVCVTTSAWFGTAITGTWL